jgi:hypothetical protein
MDVSQHSNRHPVVAQWKEKRGNRKPWFYFSRPNSDFETEKLRESANSYYVSIREIMDRVESGDEDFYPDEFYKAMGIPAPEQYQAFVDLYSCLDSQNSDYFHNHEKGLSNLVRLPRYPAATEMISHIYENIVKEPVKNIKIVCGSFWKRQLRLRYEIIKYLNKLHGEHKVGIEIYTNCGKDARGIKKLDKDIYLHCFHKLENRVMIHYILIEYENGDIRMYIEYPHSEKHFLRLFMLLTPEDFNSPALKDKKNEIKEFFEGLIEKAKK